MNQPEMPSEPEMTFPATFGRYTLTKRLGEGGMGEVYLATMRGGIEGVEKPCVIKRLRKMYTHDEEFVTRFLDEARLMVQLNHANIVPVFDAGSLDGEYFLAMEVVDGVDLRELIEFYGRSREHMPQPLALFIAREILSALSYAHKKKDAQGRSLGVVHRDISPQNILLSLAGEVKLIDFGLAKSTQKVMKTDPRVVLGKYAYMSPEQARGQPIDGRSDLFAVALLTWEMLTNRKLFDGVTVGELTAQLAEHKVFPASEVNKDIDPELDELLARALVKDVTKRFQTAEEFRDAFNRIMLRMAPNISSDDLAREVRRVRGLSSGNTRINIPINPPPAAAGKKGAPASQAVAAAAPDDESTIPSQEAPPPRAAPAPAKAKAGSTASKAAPATREETGPPLGAPPSAATSGKAKATTPPAEETTEPPAEPTPVAARTRSRREPAVPASAPAPSDPHATPTWKLVLLGLGVGLTVVGLGLGAWLALGRGDPPPTPAPVATPDKPAPTTDPPTNPTPPPDGTTATPPPAADPAKTDEPAAEETKKKAATTKKKPVRKPRPKKKK